MTGTRLKAASLLVAAAILLSACQSPTATPAATQPAATVAPTLAATATPALAAKDPGTFTFVPFSGDPGTLDPASGNDFTSEMVDLSVYETLIFYNREHADQFVPQLATEVPSQANGGISADGKTYTFKLRSGVMFHNGDPITAGDVAYTFQRGLLQGGINSPQWLIFQAVFGATAGPNNDVADLVDSSGKVAQNGDQLALGAMDAAKLAGVCKEVTDAIVADDGANTVTFHLDQPWGPFLATLAGARGAVMEKKWVSANGGWDGDCKTWQKFYAPTLDAENNLLIGKGENGTGPYILGHWTPGQEIVLKANPSYWRTDPIWPGGPSGAPKLTTIVIKVGLDDDGAMGSLRDGSADLYFGISSNIWDGLDKFVGETCDASAACVPAADASQPLRIFRNLQPTGDRHDLAFNFNINTKPTNQFIGSGKLDGNGIPPDFFTDVHVRKAFNYCFDWDRLIQTENEGEGVPAIDVMLPGEIGTSPQDPHYTHDADKCKAEFQAATLKSADGKSLWDTGFLFGLPYYSGNSSTETIAKDLSSAVAAVNPKFRIATEGLDFDSVNAAFQAHKLPAFFIFWIEDLHDPHDWLYPYVLGTFGQGQSLPADLMKPLADLVIRGVQETDPARRAATYQQFNQAYYDAAPAMLFVLTRVNVYERRWVQGYFYNPSIPFAYFYALSKQ